MLISKPFVKLFAFPIVVVVTSQNQKKIESRSIVRFHRFCVLGMFWGCFENAGNVLGMFWECFSCFGDVLGICWGCFRDSLEGVWGVFGDVLGMCFEHALRNVLDVVLKMFQT